MWAIFKSEMFRSMTTVPVQSRILIVVFPVLQQYTLISHLSTFHIALAMTNVSAQIPPLLRCVY